MLTMGIDIGSRSAKCVILDDGRLLTYGNIETGSDSAATARLAVDAAVHRRRELWGEHRMELPAVATDLLGIEDMDCIVATGYGRAVVPFAHRSVTEISCHGRGARWFVPGVATILDMGGQDCKAIRVDERGEVTRFAMNDKCAAGTGRFLEMIAEAFQLPLSAIGALSLENGKNISFSRTCAVYARSEAMAFLKQGAGKADILAGLHEAITTRAVALLKQVGVADQFVITGGIAKNVGVVTRIGAQLDGIAISIPPEPQIVGAVGAALFALDIARRKAEDQPPTTGHDETLADPGHEVAPGGEINMDLQLHPGRQRA